MKPGITLWHDTVYENVIPTFDKDHAFIKLFHVRIEFLLS